VLTFVPLGTRFCRTLNLSFIFSLLFCKIQRKDQLFNVTFMGRKISIKLVNVQAFEGTYPCIDALGIVAEPVQALVFPFKFRVTSPFVVKLEVTPTFSS